MEQPPPETPVSGPVQVFPQPVSPSEERTWSMLSHLSVLANLFTGFLGPVAALIIYLVYKDRSRLIAYHALQSMVFQIIWWLGGGILATILWIIAGALTAICIGIVLYPLAIAASLLPIGALVYGIIGAIQTSQGQDFKYWLIGDWVRSTLNS